LGFFSILAAFAAVGGKKKAAPLMEPKPSFFPPACGAHSFDWMCVKGAQIWSCINNAVLGTFAKVRKWACEGDWINKGTEMSVCITDAAWGTFEKVRNWACMAKDVMQEGASTIVEHKDLVCYAIVILVMVVYVFFRWENNDTDTEEDVRRSKSAPATFYDDATHRKFTESHASTDKTSEEDKTKKAKVEDSTDEFHDKVAMDEIQTQLKQAGEAAIEDVRLHRRQEEELQRQEEEIQRQGEEIQRQAAELQRQEAELQRQAAELQRQEAERLQNERLVGFVCNGDGSESNLSFESEEEHIPKHVKKDIYDRNERRIMEVEHLLEELNAIDPSN